MKTEPAGSSSAPVSTNRGHSGLKRRVLRKLLLFTAITLAALIVLSMTATAPENLGIRGGRFAPLSDRPNGISTMAERDPQKMDPVRWDQGDPMPEVEQIMNSLPRTRLIESGPGYLRYEVRSLIFRFIDDVEIYHDSEQDLVHFRSASRVGYSDLGVNRNRLERLSEQLKARLNERASNTDATGQSNEPNQST